MIHWLDEVDSTHRYLMEGLKNGTLCAPMGLGTDKQCAGIGSRGNEWIGGNGNLFFSFCVEEKHLPKDLPLASISIYFSALVKEILHERGSKVWLKWPNDFYIGEQKIGGIISTKIAQVIVCSFGLNIRTKPDNFGQLDISIEPYEIARLFLKRVEEKNSWKNVFSKYKIEFTLNKKFSFHLDGKLVSLADAVLCDDGSLELENKKVYSLR
ncbi:MAG: biotin--[acetyl-CoA-carboxylase] ligase [Sulfurospirillaceae bacterium]|nr:biotin--[acetyl-CoA-carboxylase] ligase [Sulfurospirillaceae bacterium]